MIVLGSVGIFIGLLGLILFRGYHHDHNIRHEIVEQKKNDFVRSVHTTIRNLDHNHSEYPLIEQRSISAPQPVIIPELVVTEIPTNQRKKHDVVIPSLHETYQNSFIVAKNQNDIKDERMSDSSEQQLRVPDRASVEFTRTRSKSGDSVMSSTFILNEDETILDDEFQNSRIFATLHALSLHSLVNIDLYI